MIFLIINQIYQVSAIKKKLHVKGYQDSINNDKKFLEIDDNLNKLNRKIKDGNILDQGLRGANKVSAMAAHLSTINKQPEQPLLQRSVSKLFYLLFYISRIFLKFKNDIPQKIVQQKSVYSYRHPF